MASCCARSSATAGALAALGVRRNPGSCCSAPTASNMSRPGSARSDLVRSRWWYPISTSQRSCSISSPTPQRVLVHRCRAAAEAFRDCRRIAGVSADHRGAGRDRRAGVSAVLGNRSSRSSPCWRAAPPRPAVSPPSRTTSPTCSIRAAPPEPPRELPIWRMISCWCRHATAQCGNTAPMTSCSRPRRNTSPMASGRAC